MSYNDAPTIAEIVGMQDLAAVAAEQVYEDRISLDARRASDAAAHLRSQMIAQGRIRPATRPEALRSTLIAKGLILPADPREVAEVYRAKFTGAKFAPTGDVDADWPWFGRSSATGFPTDEYGYER